jgi:hypothetical protein
MRVKCSLPSPLSAQFLRERKKRHAHPFSTIVKTVPKAEQIKVSFLA